MKRSTGNQEGVALLLTLVALVILGGLTGIAVLLGLGENLLGRRYVGMHQALGNAEAGALHVVTNWDPTTYNRLPVGQPQSFSGKPPVGPGSWGGTLTRMGNLMFLVVAEGVDGKRSNRQRTGLIIRLNPLRADPQAALTNRGAIEIGPSSSIDGRDHIPAGWDCQITETPLAGLRVAPAGQITNVISGCSGPQCLNGAPPVLEDSSLMVPELTRIDGQGFESLMELANQVISGGSLHPGPRVIGETCVTAARDNWGDPYVTTGPCGDYFPLVYSTGDLQLTGGRGQGTLVVDGDLSIGGGFHFVGLVLVRGTLASSGTGNRFEGAVMVANADLDVSRLLGTTTVEYSSCALERAGIGSGRPEVLQERGWFLAY